MDHIKPIIFAHRGASGHDHENSIPAFEKAVQMGADGLETDAWVLADGEVVLHHDKSVEDKKKQQHFNISNLTLKELKAIDLPNGTAVPTLREFLAKFAHSKCTHNNPIQFSIDLQDLKVGQVIIPILKEFDVVDRTVLCANTFLTLKKVRQIDANIRLVASNQEELVKPDNLGPTGKVGAIKLFAFNFQAEHFKPDLQTTIKSQNYKCFIWDLHTEQSLRKYLIYNPDAIYSNYPDLALKIRNELFK